MITEKLFLINRKKAEPSKAVWQGCEFCSQFTFTIRKNFYILTENNRFRSSHLRQAPER